MLEQLESRALLSAQPAAIPFGDVTGDGMVNAADECEIRRNTTWLCQAAEPRFDLNADGRVDVVDQLIARAAETPAVPYDGHLVTVEGVQHVFAPTPGDAGATWSVTVTPANWALLLYGPNGIPDLAGIVQGSLADCYLLAGAGAIARTNPQNLMDRLQWDGQGYSVAFNGYAVGRVVVHVPGVFSYRQAHGDELWPAVLELAYAWLRTYDQPGSTGSINTLGSIEWGNTGMVYRHLGETGISYVPTFSLAQVVTALTGAMADNRPVAVETSGGAKTLPASHAEVVTRFWQDEGGVYWVGLVNPWGPGFGQMVTLDVIQQDVSWIIVGGAYV